VEAHEQLLLPDQGAARDVGVADEHVAAGVLRRVPPDQGEDFGVVLEVAVVPVHQLGLAEVDGLDPEVDVRRGQEVEPELGLGPADVRDGLTGAPVVLHLAVRVEHVGVLEVPLLRRHAKGLERPLGDGDLFHLGRHDLEDAGLDHHVRFGLVEFRELLLRPLQVLQQVGLPAPQADRPADELRPSVLEHPNVVVQVAAAVEDALDRDRSGQVVLQGLPGNGAVELVVARLGRILLRRGLQCRLGRESEAGRQREGRCRDGPRHGLTGKQGRGRVTLATVSRAPVRNTRARPGRSGGTRTRNSRPGPAPISIRGRRPAS